MARVIESLFFSVILSVSSSAQNTTAYDRTIEKGRAQLQAGSLDMALASGEAAIKVDPSRWEAYALTGGTLLNLKRYEEAADRLSEAINRAPEGKQPALRDLRRQALLAESGTPAAEKKNAAGISQAEVVLWKSIENSQRSEDFQAYIKAYPNGAFVALANARLDAAVWSRIKDSKDADDYQAYVQRFPDGASTEIAKRRIAELAASQENALWGRMKTSDNEDDFRDYLRKYPDGQFASSARQRIEDLKIRAAQPVLASVTRLIDRTQGTFSISTDTASWTETSGKGKSNFSFTCESLGTSGRVNWKWYAQGYQYNYGTIEGKVPSGFVVEAIGFKFASGKASELFIAAPEEVTKLSKAAGRLCAPKQP